MQYVEIEGLRVSTIGLGTWQFGSREWGYGETYANEVAPALLRRALDLGISMIDTAEFYGLGRSERIIGAILAGLSAAERSGLTVATKFMPIAPVEPIVARQAAGSRRRLGVDEIDLYYIHWPNPLVSQRRLMQSVRPLLSAGVVRRVGVSNYSLGQWLDAERALRRPVVANQVSFSLRNPGPAHDLVPHAAASGRLVVAYSPLGQGLLTESDQAAPTMGMRALTARLSPTRRERLASLQDVIRAVAASHEATAAQVALAWVLHHPNTVAIPGARTIRQLEENAAAADLQLSTSEFEALTTASEAFTGNNERP